MSNESRIEGDVQITGGDFVARDKIIQHIVLVGRVLDFAQVEELIPPAAPAAFTSIAAAYEEVFQRQMGADMAEAAAAAGAILGDVLRQFKPSSAVGAVPYRELVASAPPVAIDRLQALGYWDAYRDPVTVEARFSGHEITIEGGVVWLRSVQALWQKRFQEGPLYGLALLRMGELRTLANGERLTSMALAQIAGRAGTDRIEYATGDRSPVYRGFVVRDDDTAPPVLAQPAPWAGGNEGRNDFRYLPNERAMAFVVGMTIDLIRLGSMAASGRQLLDDLAGLLR